MFFLIAGLMFLAVIIKLKSIWQKSTTNYIRIKGYEREILINPYSNIYRNNKLYWSIHFKGQINKKVAKAVIASHQDELRRVSENYCNLAENLKNIFYAFSSNDVYYELFFNSINEFINEKLIGLSVDKYSTIEDIVNLNKITKKLEELRKDIEQIINLYERINAFSLDHQRENKSIAFLENASVVFLSYDHISTENTLLTKVSKIFEIGNSKLFAYNLNWNLAYNLEFTPDHLFIYDFCLIAKEDYRKGVGTFLYNKLESAARNRCCRKIKGTLSPHDVQDEEYQKRLLGFWRRMGFEINGLSIRKDI